MSIGSEIKSYLELGREIDFLYNGKKYSFSHSEEKWYLTEYDTHLEQEFNSYQEMLNGAIVDSKCFSDICEDIIIDWVY